MFLSHYLRVLWAISLSDYIRSKFSSRYAFQAHSVPAEIVDLNAYCVNAYGIYTILLGIHVDFFSSFLYQNRKSFAGFTLP